MNDKAIESVHLLLFGCPECGNPIAVSRVSEFYNLELLDATSFRVKCDCGWSGDFLCAEARRHIVESWTSRGGELTATQAPPHSVSKSATSERLTAVSLF